jgi:GMP synthase-like glutamine amidotransferase
MPILVFQHSSTGGPGRLGTTLRDHGFALDIRRPDLGGPGNTVPSDLDNLHGVVILGGPQNVTDIAQYPWMQAEAALIKKAHDAQLPILGICLGHQLIAHALGGEVAFKQAPDVGMGRLLINTTGQVEPLLAGIAWDSPQFFACEQEVTKLPPGATLLASTARTKNSIFKVGLRTLGIQPHFECDRPMLDTLVSLCKDQIERAGGSIDGVRADIERDYAAYARLSDRLCVNLATLCWPTRRKLAG